MRQPFKFKLNQMSLVFWIHFQQVSYFVLFELIVWFRLFSLSSKSAFVSEFACFNLAAKCSAASVLNSEVATYSSCLWFVYLFSISVTFVLQSGVFFD